MARVLRGLGCLVALTSVMRIATAQGPDSCVGKCGTWSDDCWCNTECESHGNCCTDYQHVCTASCTSCPGSTYNCDEWINWDPSRYSCENLETEWRCDCSGCQHCSGPSPAPPSPAPPSPPPRTNAAKLALFDEAKYPEARCLDGSQAGYYFRQGEEVDRYIIYFNGGGWCYDDNCANPTQDGTLQNCRSRAQGRLGSSRSWRSEQDRELTGLLSSDPSQNPAFHNWTLVNVPYCDGASFTGDNTVGGLHFRGQAIRRALLQELRAVTNISRGKQVVLSGGSAGASTVYYHADAIAEELALEGDGEVLALPDAGFFLDLPDRFGIDCWPAQMRSLFEVSNGYQGLHKGCLTRYPKDPSKCLFPQYYADLIQTRLLALNSFYDSSEQTYTLRLDCCAGGSCGPRYPTCTGEEQDLFLAMREEHMRAWAPLISRNGSGVWAPACVAHTMAWEDWTATAWEVPAGSGNTMAAVVESWLNNRGSDGKRFDYQDDVAWPQNRPCASSTAYTTMLAPKTSPGLLLHV